MLSVLEFHDRKVHMQPSALVGITRDHASLEAKHTVLVCKLSGSDRRWPNSPPHSIYLTQAEPISGSIVTISGVTTTRNKAKPSASLNRQGWSLNQS